MRILVALLFGLLVMGSFAYHDTVATAPAAVAKDRPSPHANGNSYLPKPPPKKRSNWKNRNYYINKPSAPNTPKINKGPNKPPPKANHGKAKAKGVSGQRHVRGSKVNRPRVVIQAPPVIVVTPTIAPDPKIFCPRPMPPEPNPKFFSGDIDFTDDAVTLAESAVGVVGLLTLLMMFTLVLYGGYVLGYKDKERTDTNFMRALLESVALKKKPN